MVVGKISTFLRLFTSFLQCSKNDGEQLAQLFVDLLKGIIEIGFKDESAPGADLQTKEKVSKAMWRSVNY